MVDFIGPGAVGIYDNAGDANRYARESNEAADARWIARERRARYDEGNRLNRRVSAEDAAAYQQQAGLFTSMGDELVGTTRRNRTPIAAPGSATNTTGGTNQQATAAPAPDQPTTATTQDMDGTVRDSILQPGSNTVRPLTPREMTPEQAQVWTDYVEATRRMNWSSGRMDINRGTSRAETQRWTNRLREVGIHLRNGNPVTLTPNYNNQGLTPTLTADGLSWPNIPEDNSGLTVVDPGADTAPPQSAATRTTGTAGIAAPGEDPIYNQWNDTSRPMEESPEMQLVHATIQNGIRRAQIYAQHGRADLAEEAFSGAVERQLAYFQMGNMAMLRSAASGNMSAAEALIARANSYPREAVRLSPLGGTGRMALQIQGEDGSWTSASSMTRPQLFNSLRAYADAAGAAADAESQQAIQIAMMNNERYLAIADMEQRTAVMRILHETGRAELAQRVELQIARGQARMYMNSETGGAYITYMDDQGNPAYAYTSMEDVPTPGTNGNETVEMPVMRNITSMNGVRPNQ